MHNIRVASYSYICLLSHLSIALSCSCTIILLASSASENCLSMVLTSSDIGGSCHESFLFFFSTTSLPYTAIGSSSTSVNAQSYKTICCSLVSLPALPPSWERWSDSLIVSLNSWALLPTLSSSFPSAQATIKEQSKHMQYDYQWQWLGD